MTGVATFVLGSVLVAALLALIFVDAAVLARWVRRFGWLAVAGVALLVLPRLGGLALFILPLALPWLLRKLASGRGGTAPSPGVSTVRSAAIEMELDHETGEMDGLVLAGTFESRTLNGMDEAELEALRLEVADDPESVALLDAYLDRRFPGRREDAQPDPGTGQGGAARAGPMSEQDAYEVLGLAPGASASDIREAHRRLMKGAHPDLGGSTFLASQINEAKDVLLARHDRGPGTQD